MGRKGSGRQLTTTQCPFLIANGNILISSTFPKVYRNRIGLKKDLCSFSTEIAESLELETSCVIEKTSIQCHLFVTPTETSEQIQGHSERFKRSATYTRAPTQDHFSFQLSVFTAVMLFLPVTFFTTKLLYVVSEFPPYNASHVTLSRKTLSPFIPFLGPSSQTTIAQSTPSSSILLSAQTPRLPKYPSGLSPRQSRNANQR